MTPSARIDPALPSWVPVAPDSDFPLQNLPYGVFRREGENARVGVAIGESVLDLAACARAELFSGYLEDAVQLFSPGQLNRLLSAGPRVWSRTRARLIELLSAQSVESPTVSAVQKALFPRKDVQLLLPFAVADYVDFYSSLEHATNMGKILRPGGEALMPNWRYLPIGYHGRASTVVVDGTDVVRPRGQSKLPDVPVPCFGPSTMLDIELEMGFVTGPGNELGRSIPTSAAREHIFGLVLVNDWSARDIQGWEYQPLGPFLGKSFATSISPWVVTLDALEPFRVAGPHQEPQPMEYLRVSDAWNYDVKLQVLLETRSMREAGEQPAVISTTNFKEMYWNMAQQLAHMTVNGTVIRPGDLYASGTISGPTPNSFGSLMELTWRGSKPLVMPSGEERRFLEDGDRVLLRGWCEREGIRRIGFGEVTGTILPARVMQS